MHMYYGQDVRVVVTARAVWLRCSGMHTASSPHTHDACSILLWRVFGQIQIFFVRVFVYVMLRMDVAVDF